MIIADNRCTAYSDKELVIKSLEEVDYFGCLYQRYEERLSRYIRRLSGLSSEDALDILQDVYVKVWRHLNDYDPDLPFSSWLYRIAHNVTINTMKQSRRRINHKIQVVDEIQPWSEILPDSRMDEQYLTWLNDGLEALNEKYRHVLILHYLEGENYKDISDILKIPMGTVATRINRGKQALRTWITDRQKLMK